MLNAATRGSCFLLMLASAAAFAQETEDSTDLMELLADSGPPSVPAEASPDPGQSTDTAGPQGEQQAAAAEAQEPEPTQIETIPVQARAEAPAEKAPAAAPARPKAEGIEEIVVTATKREKNVREIPITVNALDAETLAKNGAQDLRDYLTTVPGVTLSDISGGVGRTSMRGITMDAVNVQGGSTTGVLIDDAGFSDPANQIFLPDLNTFDLQTVEIMKGPQGTLFGAGGLSGAIRYSLQKPVIGRWAGRGFAQSVSVDEGQTRQTYGAALNVPLPGDTAALRFVGVSREIPGYVDDLTAGKQDYDADSASQTAWRTLGTWDITDSVNLTGFYLHQKGRIDSISSTTNYDGELSRSNTPGGNATDTEFDIASLNLSFERSWATVSFHLNRVTKDFGIDQSHAANLLPPPLSSLDLVRMKSYQDIQGWQEEIRFVSPSGQRFEWVGGIFAQQYDSGLTLDIPIIGDPGPILGPILGTPLGQTLSLITFNGPVGAEEVALFGEGTLKFFDDRLETTLGMRLYRTGSDADFETGGLLVNGLTGSTTPSTKTGKISAQGINPKAAINWRATDNFSLYSSAARGFRYGGFNNTPDNLVDDVPFSYKSDTLWNYELGLRTDWLEQTLRVDLTGFYIDWKNPQIFQKTNSGLFQYIDNVAAARSTGAELSAHWLTPLPGLSLHFNGGYVKAVTTKPFVASNGDEVAPGTEMPATPNLQYNYSANYVFPIPGGWLMNLSATRLHVGQAWTTITHDAPILDYKTWQGSIRLSHPGLPGQPELTLSGDNLSNVRAITLSSPAENLNDPLVTYLRPRQITLRLGFSFGD